MADALQDLLRIVHEAIVEDGLEELYVPKVALALSSLPACRTGELHGIDPQSEVIGPAMHRLVPFVDARLGDLRHRPRLQFRLGEGAEPDKAYLCRFTSRLFEQVA